MVISVWQWWKTLKVTEEIGWVTPPPPPPPPPPPLGNILRVYCMGFVDMRYKGFFLVYPVDRSSHTNAYIYGLMQDYIISIANTLEIL